ncbi:KTSC domain-containing protein [Niabella hirudinis]|uniref:KTSC domain-containing protein n=1 Tax=Niabella hirudinis TaxID=1285929 RepID=UPI003EBC0E32
MIREYVESSMITSFGFDPSISTLEIEFKSGVVWQYFDVPDSVYYEMKSAASFGKFFHANIKGQYAESQVG